MAKPIASDEIYNEYYYRHDCGTPYERTPEWLAFFGGVAEKITKRIHPGSVLDAGCALGFLVEGLRERGVEAFGVDISEYAIQNVYETIKPYCHVGSLLEPLPQRYDLIVCIEVLEHLQPHTSELAIENLCKASDDIIFSSSPLDYYEVTHFNVQPPEHWADLFALQGFVRDVDFDASFITPWAVRFRKNSEPLHQIVRNYERRFWLLWKESQDTRRLALDTRNQMVALEANITTLESNVAALESNVADLKFSSDTAEQDLAEKNERLAEKDKQLIENDLIIQEKEHILQSIYASRAWRFVVLLRRLKDRLHPSNSVGKKSAEKIYRSHLPVRGFFLVLDKGAKLFVDYVVNSLQHLRLYGIRSLLSRVFRKIRLIFKKDNSFSALEKNDDLEKNQSIDSSILLRPLDGFSIPYSGKRINIVLDRLGDENVFDGTADAIILAVLLAEKWGSELRIITRLDIAQKSALAHILKNGDISGPNVEFLFVPAGSSKVALPVGGDEMFLATSWVTVSSIKQNFDPKKIICLLWEDERSYPYSQQNRGMCDDVLQNRDVQFVIRTSKLYDDFVSEGFENMRDKAFWFEPASSTGQSMSQGDWRVSFEKILSQIQE